MFADSYFPAAYWPNSYWPVGEESPAPAQGSDAGGPIFLRSYQWPADRERMVKRKRRRHDDDLFSLL